MCFTFANLARIERSLYMGKKMDFHPLEVYDHQQLIPELIKSFQNFIDPLNQQAIIQGHCFNNSQTSLILGTSISHLALWCLNFPYAPFKEVSYNRIHFVLSSSKGKKIEAHVIDWDATRSSTVGQNELPLPSSDCCPSMGHPFPHFWENEQEVPIPRFESDTGIPKYFIGRISNFQFSIFAIFS